MHDRSSPPQRRAFTILELMISTVLMSVLLAGTWALLGIYQGQFEKSQDRVERWQLIRSLQSQLTDDLKACHVPAHELRADESRTNMKASLDSPGPETPGPDSPETNVNEAEVSEAGNARIDMPATSRAAVTGMFTTDMPTDSSEALVLREWMSPAVALEGTKDALILDILPPTHPGDAQSVSRPKHGDTVARVVYVFVDPLSAAVQGRPAGLVRCQWKAHELQSMFATHSGAVDLYALIQQVKNPNRGMTGTTLPDESTTDGDVSSTGASKLSLPGLQTVDITRLDDDVIQRIDIIPELTSLLFSYYDGQQWHSNWSFAQRRQLPVAVEMRFDLAKPKSPQALQDSDPTVAAQRLLRERNESQVALERPGDDRIRSSQVEAPIGYRWLIYLGGPQPDQESELLEEEVVARRD